jgi:hypothetical protein
MLLWAALAAGTQPDETYAEAVHTDGPVADFRFDDATGSSTVADSAGAYSATNSGITLGAEGPFGGSKSGSFGGEAYASLPSNPLAGATAFTAEGWVYWTGGSSYEQPIFDFGSNGSDYMFLTPAGDSKHQLLFEIRNSLTDGVQVTATKLSAMKWNYVAVTETTGGTLTLYVNGEQVGQTTGSTLFPSSLESSPDDYLGKSQFITVSSFNGSLSNIAFYGTALSSERIKAHYDAAEYPVNTVAPTITGTERDGSTLTAKVGTWTGLTPITYAYQWLLCNSSGSECGNISSATSNTYKAIHEDAGRALRVAVTATNSAGGSAAATSAQTGTIEALKPSNTALPTISGPAESGHLLTVNTGSWEGTPPFSYTYQWKKCNSTGSSCGALSGATSSSYRILSSQVGDTLRAAVTASNAAGSVKAESAATATATAGPPANTELPAISGTAVEGHTLTTSTGSWAGTEPFSYAFQWQRCNVSGESCSNIAGATGESYSLTAGDIGTTLRSIVTAKDSVGSTSATSPPSEGVAGPPTNTGAPEIEAGNEGEELDVEEGQTLYVATGTWAGYPEPGYSFQWQDCYGDGECLNIKGATEQFYTLGASDVATFPRVIVTVTNSAGSSTDAVELSIAVKARPPVNERPPTLSGAPRVGQSLTANQGEWSGGKLVTFSYQWEDCEALGGGCVDISGATGSTYTVTPSDIDSTVRVAVTATAVGYAMTTTDSQATATIGPGATFADDFGSAGSGAGQFSEPADVASGGEGDIWVLDRGNDRVEKLNERGEYESQFGSEGSGDGQLNQSDALALGPSGSIWVLDTGNKRVEEFNSDGEYVSQFSVEGTLLEGIAVDKDGDIWVSNAGDGEGGITVFSSSGEVLKHVSGGGSGPGELGEPESLAVDSAGDVWVADWQNDRVEEFNEAGEYVREFGAAGTAAEKMSHPYGIAVGPNNEVWVGEVGENRVQEFTEDGEYLGEFGGSYGTAPGELELKTPMGLTAATDAVLVADGENNRIDEWQTPPVAPTNVAAPTISGELVDGATLTATPGEWSGAPTRYDYQWQSCNATGGECSSVGGAESSSYTLGSADTGRTVKVIVSAINTGGPTPAASLPTSVISAATAPTNTAEPTISGTPDEGSTLSAETGAWSGTAATYAYQWESCDTSGEGCAPIEGATEADYLLGEGDIGSTVRVVVTATNPAGTAHATSPASAVVADEPATELEAPSISGTPDEHNVLYAGHGAWSGTERQFSYQWESCSATGAECAPLEGATEPEYDLGEGDVSTTVRVRIGMSSAAGSLTDVSPVTSVIGSVGALANTEAPRVTGTPEAGQLLTASHGSWTATGTLSYTYQWQTCDQFGEDCTNIESATGATYTAAGGDAGHTLRAQVEASSEGHSASRLSPVTQPIAAAAAPVPQQAPVIHGVDLKGSTLTTTGGEWSGEGTISYSYQWERCSAAGACTPIEAATADGYTLTETDAGSTLRTAVTATNSSGSAVAVSPATAQIEPEALHSFSTPSISGVIEIGGELEVDPGIWSGTGPISHSYQWESCNSSGEDCTAIGGATEPSYLLTEGDHGSTLRVKVTITGPLGSETAYSPVTAATPGGEVTAEQAEEAAQATDPDLLAASTTATLEGETIAPTLGNEEQLFSAHALTSSSVSKENPGEFAVNTPDGELSVKPLESSPDASTVPTLVNGTVALIANTSPATDTIIRPDARGATAVLHLRSAEAPTSFSWEVGLGAGQQLEQLTNGSVAVASEPEASSEPGADTSAEPEALESEQEIPETSTEHAERERDESESETEIPTESAPASPESSTTPGEASSGELEPQDTTAQYESATTAMSAAEGRLGAAALMVVEAPIVIDSHGTAVPAVLSVHEDTITLTIRPSGTTTYPLVAAVSVAAPSDKVSGERDPFEYGLADELAPDFANENVLRLTAASPRSPLYVQTARRTIPWDLHRGFEETEHKKFNEWLSQVEADHLKPYVTFKSDEVHHAKLPEYREGVRRTIKEYDGRIKRWGAWNEPELSPNNVLPQLAGHYWQAAESVAVELHCGCTIVAGEFAQFETNAERKDNGAEDRVFASKYKSALTEYFPGAWDYKGKFNKPAWKKHRQPSTWGLHDYADVAGLRETNLREFEEFARGNRLGNPRIWISEAGVLLHTGGDPGTSTELVKSNDEKYEYEQQSKAAQTLLDLHEVRASHEKISRVERVYYYTFGAPSEALVATKPNEFDSGLFESKPEDKHKSYGEPRPAYCYLAYAGHDCPPTVAILSPERAEAKDPSDVYERVSVNPHGVETTVKFLRNGGETTATKTIGVHRAIHP